MLVVTMGVKSRRKLGILVASARHTGSVGQLIISARAKGVSVWVCLVGPAIGALPAEAVMKLAGLARLAICRDAQDGMAIPENLRGAAGQCLMISSKQMLELLARCDRWVVF